MKEFVLPPEEELWLKVSGNHIDPGPIPDEYEAGKPCDQLYDQILAAKDRLCEQYGIHPDCREWDEIFCSFEEISRILGLKMYEYGKKGIL